jgi:hypothetical protein
MEKPPHYFTVTKIEPVARIRYSRGGREAIATSVKVAGICTSDVKAEETDLDIPVWFPVSNSPISNSCYRGCVERAFGKLFSVS